MLQQNGKAKAGEAPGGGRRQVGGGAVVSPSSPGVSKPKENLHEPITHDHH